MVSVQVIFPKEILPIMATAQSPIQADEQVPEVVTQPETPALRMTYEEYLAWTGEDNKLVEWVNGEVIVHMPPLFLHQNLVRFLAGLLDLFIQMLKAGRLLVASFEVKLWPDGSSREPDILFVAQEHLDRLTDKRLEGAPDLVVEIISDDSVSRDRVDKFDEYEQAGVREYWIVDPRPGRLRAWFYTLDETGIFQPLLLDPDGRLHSQVLPGFWLRPDWLWQEPLPAPLQILAEILGPERVRAALE